MTAPLRTGHRAAGARAAAPRLAPEPAPVRPALGPRQEPARRLRTPPAPPRLRLVDPTADRRRRLTRALTIALVVAICAGLFAIVGLRVLLAQGQVQVDRLEAAAESQRAAQQRLRLTVAELEAPARIVADARARLGMVNPGVVIHLTPPPATAR